MANTNQQSHPDQHPPCAAASSVTDAAAFNLSETEVELSETAADATIADTSRTKEVRDDSVHNWVVEIDAQVNAIDSVAVDTQSAAEQPPALQATSSAVDERLYVPESENWQARIKTNGERDYCYSATPGQDYFHLLLQGEIYLESGDEKLCLNCARRRGVMTSNRLFWQRFASTPPP